MRNTVCAAALVLALVTPGCTWFRRSPKAPAPPPPPSPDIVRPAPKPKPRVLEPPASPPVTTRQDVPAIRPPLPETSRPAPTPPPAAKSAPRSSGRRPAPAETKKPETVQVSPPSSVPADPPRLGEVLDPEQRKQVERSFQENQGLARQAIDALAKYRLTRDQQDTLARARSFLQQAEGLTESDLSTAAQLARRANLLARDLLNSLR